MGTSLTEVWGKCKCRAKKAAESNPLVVCGYTGVDVQGLKDSFSLYGIGADQRMSDPLKLNLLFEHTADCRSQHLHPLGRELGERREMHHSPEEGGDG